MPEELPPSFKELLTLLAHTGEAEISSDGPLAFAAAALSETGILAVHDSPELRTRRVVSIRLFNSRLA